MIRDHLKQPTHRPFLCGSVLIILGDAIPIPLEWASSGSSHSFLSGGCAVVADVCFPHFVSLVR